MLKPIRDRVIVRPVDTDKSLHGPSALLVTTADVDDIRRGEVVAVGDGFVTPDGERIPLSLRVGHTVIFDKSVGKAVWSFGERYLVLREQEVLSVEEAQGPGNGE